MAKNSLVPEDQTAPPIPWSPPMQRLMVKLKRWHGQTFDPAMVRRVARVAGGRIIIRKLIETRGVGEVVEFGHVGAHVVCPFEDLGPDVHQESVRGPSAKNHDASGAVVHEEQSHSRAGTYGWVAQVVGVEAVGAEATRELASQPENPKRERRRDARSGASGREESIDRSGWRSVGERRKDTGDS